MSASQPVSLSLQGLTLLAQVGPFRPLLLQTSAGEMEARLYEVAAPETAVLWLGDAYGGFDSPAQGMYDRLAERFQALGVLSLRLQYREPASLPQSGLDALVGTFLLQQQGLSRVVVVGHGLGAVGAVQAGLHFTEVAGVAVIGAHPAAAEGVERLAPRPFLILHGTADHAVPTRVARELLDRAKEPKRVYYYQNAGHDLTEAADAATLELGEWIEETLALRKA